MTEQFAREFNVDKYLAQQSEKEKKVAPKKPARPAAKTPESGAIAVSVPLTKAIGIERIAVTDRLRTVERSWVVELSRSMDALGLQSPITVTPDDADGYRLVAGAHRLEAAKLLNWQTIEAKVVSGDALELRLREIDENLLRRELSQLDRAAHLAERQRIYEEINPESKRGPSGALARWMQTQTISFASETAEKCGLSERSIQLAIQRYSRIAPDVRARIALTRIAEKGTELDALARLLPDEQRKAVNMVLSGASDVPKTVAAAGALVRGVRTEAKEHDPADAAFMKFVNLWKSAPEKAREMIVSHLVAKGYCAPVEAREAA